MSKETSLKYDEIKITPEILTKRLWQIGIQLPPSVLDEQGIIRQEIFDKIDPSLLPHLKDLFIQTIIHHTCLGFKWILPFVYQCLGIESDPNNSLTTEPRRSLNVVQREQILSSHIDAYCEQPKQQTNRDRRKNYFNSLFEILNFLIEILNKEVLQEHVSVELHLSDICYPFGETISLEGLRILNEIIYKMSGLQLNLPDVVENLKAHSVDEAIELLARFEKQLKRKNLPANKRLSDQQLRDLRERSNSYFQ